MLSILYLVLWQSLLLVLSLLVVNQVRTVRQLVLPLIILIQLIQQVSLVYQAVGWMNSTYFTAIVFSTTVAGYGRMLLRYILQPIVLLFTKMLLIMQLLWMLLIGLLPSSGMFHLISISIWVNSIALLVPTCCVLYQSMKNPPQPLQHNSFRPIVWFACGVLFYLLITLIIQISTIVLPPSSFPPMVGWLAILKIVQHVVMYVFFTVALVICLRQPPQTL